MGCECQGGVSEVQAKEHEVSIRINWESGEFDWRRMSNAIEFCDSIENLEFIGECLRLQAEYGLEHTKQEHRMREFRTLYKKRRKELLDGIRQHEPWDFVEEQFQEDGEASRLPREHQRAGGRVLDERVDHRTKGRKRQIPLHKYSAQGDILPGFEPSELEQRRRNSILGQTSDGTWA